MARIHFLTGNEGKLVEAVHHLGPLGHEVVHLSVDGIIEPQADDLETIARSKLEQARAHLPNPDDWLMVEDAGLGRVKQTVVFLALCSDGSRENRYDIRLSTHKC